MCASLTCVISKAGRGDSTVQMVDEDLVQVCKRLREKYERRSEAEAETSQMNLLDFAHREGETVNSTIDRESTIVMPLTRAAR